MTCIAYAVNRDTGALTKWTDVGFARLWMLNGKPYFVRADGVHVLAGAEALPVMTAEVQVAPMNFGTDNLKRALYAIANGDGAVQVTPIYDATVGAAYSEQFTQASRIKFGKGNKSRWLGMKIASTDKALKLTSLMIEAQTLSRKVT